MQKQDYRNFNEERPEEEIAVGVPVSLPMNPIQAPYFPQPYPQPHHAPGPYPPQEGSFNQLNHGHPPAQHMPYFQAMPPQPVQPMILDYSNPISIRCPCCSNFVQTVLNKEPGNAAYLWAGLICIFINPCCACVPFVTDKCMDRNHYCPQCGFNIVRKHKGFLEC